MVAVSSWGRLTHLEHDVEYLADRHHVASQICSSKPGIAIGMARSYGDVCLNPNGRLWNTTRLDRFIGFDDVNGVLVCESGILLRDIQREMIPRGWALPVTPGTQYITVGGAIANDVHGKNHHTEGTFGDHVIRFRLARTDGEIIECGPQMNADWFAATVGGVGLTGVIIEAEIQLRRVAGPWIETETIPYANLAEFFELADDSEAGWEYTVSWIDCQSGGRGLFMRGNPADVRDRSVRNRRQWTMSIAAPFSLVNPWSLRLFNMAYFSLKKSQGRSIEHCEPFFYPLDNLLLWNRIYGPKGFYQYQCLIPRANGQEVIQEILDEIRHSGDGSFLAVLKTFGDRQPTGMLSFAKPGVTLALDFPNKGERTLRLFDRLDRKVRDAAGRIYLAKDARMPRRVFEAGYPRLQEFLPYRDPGVSSEMSRRLMGN